MKIELMMMMIMSQMIMRDELSLLHDIRPSRRELQRNLVVESENIWHINDFSANNNGNMIYFVCSVFYFECFCVI